MGRHARRPRTHHVLVDPGRHPRLAPRPTCTARLCGRRDGRGSRAALAAEVLLFADLGNPTSNGLYQRIDYRPVTDFAVYDF